MTVNKSKRKPKSSKKPNRKNWRQIYRFSVRGVLGFLICAGLGFGGWKAYQKANEYVWFPIEIIEVSPLKRLKKEEIAAISRITLGQSLLGVDLKHSFSLLSKNPWIEEVKIRRHFPATIIIEVAERSPEAIINLDYLRYVDRDGTIFTTLSESDSLDYPLITGITQADIAIDPKSSMKAMQESLLLVDILKKREGFNLSEVSEVHYDKGYGFTLFTMEAGIPIRVGSGSYERKFARLSMIYPELKLKKADIEYIDLNFPDKIIVKNR